MRPPRHLYPSMRQRAADRYSSTAEAARASPTPAARLDDLRDRARMYRGIRAGLSSRLEGYIRQLEELVEARRPGLLSGHHDDDGSTPESTDIDWSDLGDRLDAIEYTIETLAVMRRRAWECSVDVENELAAQARPL